MDLSPDIRGRHKVVELKPCKDPDEEQARRLAHASVGNVIRVEADDPASVGEVHPRLSEDCRRILIGIDQLEEYGALGLLEETRNRANSLLSRSKISQFERDLIEQKFQAVGSEPL